MAAHLPTELLTRGLAAPTDSDDEAYAKRMPLLLRSLRASLNSFACGFVTLLVGYGGLMRRFGRTSPGGRSSVETRASAVLKPHLLPSNEWPTIVAEVITAARTTSGDTQACAAALIRALPHLQAEERRAVLTEALAAVRAIGHEASRAKALVDLAPHLLQRSNLSSSPMPSQRPAHRGLGEPRRGVSRSGAAPAAGAPRRSSRRRPRHLVREEPRRGTSRPSAARAGGAPR
jgi:hypothetical protein